MGGRLGIGSTHRGRNARKELDALKAQRALDAMKEDADNEQRKSSAAARASMAQRVSPEAYPVPPGSTLLAELLSFFRSLRVPDGPLLGEPWVVLDYQLRALEYLCDPVTRRVIISIPRKAGKTAFAAALLLATICGPLARRNSSVYSAARSRDQASLVFALAQKIINVTPWMQSEVHVTESRKMLKGLRYNVEYKALAADSKRNHGLSPVFLIHDELGQVTGETDDLYDALETAVGAQQSPKSLIISTQAADDADLLSRLIDDGIAADDPRTRVILYAADATDNPWSEKTWRKCHPAYGFFRNPVEFKEASDRAQRLPTAEMTFRRYYLNQRVSGETGIVTPNVWKANRKQPNLELFTDGRPVYAGLDLSQKQDLTSAALVCEDDDRNVHVISMSWTPSATLLARARRDKAPYMTWRDLGFLRVTPGSSVSYSHVITDFVAATAGMNVVSVGYDRWRIAEFMREMERLGIELPLKSVGQGYRDISPRIELTTELLLNEQLRHGGNPVLTSAATSCTIIRDSAGNQKLDKSREFGRIDPMVALVMAIGEMARSDAEAPVNIPILVL